MIAGVAAIALTVPAAAQDDDNDVRGPSPFHIFDKPGPDVPDTPQALPERHLNLFFHTLRVPYRAFEAENPQAVADAIAEIDKLERNPIRYQERIPEKDLAWLAYAVAAAALALLLLAKLLEVRLEAGAAAPLPAAKPAARRRDDMREAA